MKCPYLRETIIVPFRDKKYYYCSIYAEITKKKGCENKKQLKPEHLTKYCLSKKNRFFVNCKWYS